VDARRERERQAWRTYVIAQLPGWIIAIIVTIALFRVADLPAWAAVCLLASWIGSGLLAYPRVKRYYTPEPAQHRIIGEPGVTTSVLAPEGFVRVNGELWQARTVDAARDIAEGARIRVREVRGLQLWVEPDEAS
jgi:membrane protein implicated in regulation of membrane protease activity